MKILTALLISLPGLSCSSSNREATAQFNALVPSKSLAPVKGYNLAQKAAVGKAVPAKFRQNMELFSTEIEPLKDADPADEEAGTATVASSTFNLAKTILGAGILSLPGGIARFSDSPSALIPSYGLLAVMGLMSAYSFNSIGKACATHDVGSFAEAWAESVNKDQANWINALVSLKTFFACLAYSIIIGDTFTQILASTNLNPALIGRSNVITGISAFILFPLCLMKKLDALKYTSLLGLLGTVYTLAFMIIRFFDGSYVEGGQFFGAISESLRPSFNVRTGPQSPFVIFVLISMISTAYVAHFNAPKFYAELKERTMKNYNKLVTAGFSVSIITYMIIATVGFLQFGGNSTGFVLNNYATTDKLATLARFSIGMGIVCGYPLTFSALREGLFGLFNIQGKQRDTLLVPTTLAVLGLLTSLALVLTNLGTVVSFSGALIGSLLIYIVPAFMNIFNIRRKVGALIGQKRAPKGTVVSYSRGQKLEILINILMAVAGATIAVIGVGINLVGV